MSILSKISCRFRFEKRLGPQTQKRLAVLGSILLLKLARHFGGLKSLLLDALSALKTKRLAKFQRHFNTFSFQQVALPLSIPKKPFLYMRTRAHICEPISSTKAPMRLAVSSGLSS